ncbi:MAG: HprK-related kinase A [Pseudomonadota bacterium]
MTVDTLSRAELVARLAGDGLELRTGAFVTRLQTRIPSVADGISLLYADYPLGEYTGFADFHLRMFRPAGWRRWYRPQVQLQSDGNAPFTPLPLAHAFPMFEWGLNWCVASRAHNHLIIHAAVVEKEGRAAILPAPPGSGKSTLCTALVHRGWRLLSDELALIRLDDGHVMPLPRPISLKNASIALMRDYLDSPVFSTPVHDTIKGTVAHLKAPRDSVLRSAEPARPAWIIFPQYAAGAEPELSPLSPARGHMELAQNAFNYSMLGSAGFHAMARVIGMSSCHQFRYSRLDDAVELFRQLQPVQP